MIGILGSGFGLYGYLPAIVKCTNDDIILLERYKAKFDNRMELVNFRERIIWAKDEHSLLNNSESIILSRPPTFQRTLVEKCLNYSNIEKIILEKPLSNSPSLSSPFLKTLFNSHKVFRIGYTFQYTDWGIKLLDFLASKDKSHNIKIEWSFMAHHYKNNLDNWKRYNSFGGSVIRFYGIHLIALSALLGYDSVSYSKSYGFSENDIFKWESALVNDLLPSLDISVNSNSDKQCFSVKIYSDDCSTNKPIFQIEKFDPFTDVYSSYVNNIDPRVDILTNIIESLNDDNNSHYYNYYDNCNKLWHKIEECNINITS